MHNHHTDMFSGTEAGVRFAEYAFAGGVSPSRPSPTPTRTKSSPSSPTPTKSRPAKPAPTKPRPSEPTRAKPRPSTPNPAVAQAKEAIKDGKIQPNEKKVVEKAPVRDAIKGERTRLQESVNRAEGAREQLRDKDGKLELRDGKPIDIYTSTYADTDHERRVDELTQDKDKRSLDAIDTQISALEDAGVTTGLDALKEDRRERARQEQQVAGVIEDKESLVGTLEAEKARLEAGEPDAAANDYQGLREDAQKWLDQFNANGGQTHEADVFGDDWDNEDGNVTFNQLAKDLADEGRLNDFAKVQGREDEEGGDDAASMERHIADVIADDPAEGGRIALRYQAAQELQGIFRQYNEAKDTTENNGESIAQIDAEIGILNESIAEDRKALSNETLEALDEANASDTDIIPAAQYGPSKSGPSTPSGSDGAGEGDEPGGAGSGTDATDNGNGNGTDGAGGTNGGGGADNAGTDEAGPADIDYTTPENRDRVLTQAREQNLVPAENTTFNDQGQAIYTVQPNDSYWRISDMSDGKPQEFDPQHFAATVQSNSERFGRDPQVGLIHPNEQVVIPGRSVDELVVLMGLPTTEQAPAEEEQDRQGGGGGHVYVE